MESGTPDQRGHAGVHEVRSKWCGASEKADESLRTARRDDLARQGPRFGFWMLVGSLERNVAFGGTN